MGELLTRNEEKLMEIFWEENRPLTSIDIAEMRIKSTWSRNYIQNIIRSLLKKNMIKECGRVQYHTQYARQFIANITKEEYVAKQALSVGITKKSVVGVVSALVKEVGDEEDRETIQKLEELLQGWQESEGEEEK